MTGPPAVGGGGPVRAHREPGEPRDEHLVAGARPRHPDRARVAALDELALVAAMRDGDAWAWSEFHARFRPVLLAVTGRMVVPDGCATTRTDALVDEVLADEAARLTAPDAPPVANLAGYLVRAARHKLASLRRSAARRHRWHGVAMVREPGVGRAVVATLCSEHLLRTTAGPVPVAADDAGDAATDAPSDAPSDAASDAASDDAASAGILALAATVRAATTEPERLLLTWVAEGVSHRVIAGWLGVSYDAATKRVWRLCRKLRDAALRHVAALEPEARRELARFLRRAGALPPLVAAVSLAAAQRRYPRTPFDDVDVPRRAPARGDDPEEPHDE